MGRNRMTKSLYKSGDRVRVLCVPPSLAANTEEHLVETAALFGRCVGQVLRVEDIRDSELVLYVNDDGSQAPNSCGHIIWIEPECVELVEPAKAKRMYGSERYVSGLNC